jgi:hypothetical protein
MHALIGIVINALAEKLTHGDVDSELLLDLALQALLRGLPDLDLSAGKLP